MVVVGPSQVVTRLLTAVTPRLREVARILGLGGPFRGAGPVLKTGRPSLTPLLRRRLPVLQVLLRHPVRALRLEEAEVDRVAKRQDVRQVVAHLEEGLGVVDAVLPGASSSPSPAILTPVRVMARFRTASVLSIGVLLCRLLAVDLSMTPLRVSQALPGQTS